VVIHVRAVTPPDITSELVAGLAVRQGVLNLIVLPSVARNPDGDALQFDVTNAEANDVLDHLRARGVATRGSIVLDDVGTELSERAREAEAHTPRALRLSPVWTQAEGRIRAGGRYPPSWFALLVIAGLIAAVGIFTNSQILIVGAMVVGPEYAAIISVSLGITRWHGPPVWAGTAAVTVGFLLAIAFAFAFSLVVRAAGWESQAFRVGIRPVSSFINTPDVFSVIVAVLAGIVGVVSIVEARTGALIGVFISVTTIPAAADIGVSLAFAQWSEAAGSVTQLLLNLTILTAVGAAGLVVQRRFWERLGRRATAAHTSPRPRR
jgi:uncharacterized hydrophobic protein (TIGR00271 family)